jgi:alpha-1,2-mannosyltransferase
VTSSPPGTTPPAPGPLSRLGAWIDRQDVRFAPRTSQIVLVLLVAIALQTWFVHTRKGSDFQVFHVAAQRFIAGEPLYRSEDGADPFKYLPAAALPLLPLSTLPLPAASLLWVILAAVALARVQALCAERLPDRQPLSTHLAVMVLLFPFSIHLFSLGQSDALLLWLVLVSQALARSRPWASGFLWAIACIFKLPFLALLPIALLDREWRRLAGLGLGMAVGIALPSLRYGWAGNLELLASWRSILDSTTPPMLCYFMNQGVFGIACTYLADPADPGRFRAAVLLLAATVVLLLGAAVLAIRARDRADGRRAAFEALLYLSAFLSPLGWRTNLIAAAPLFYRLLGLARGVDARIRHAAWATLAVVFLVQRVNYEVVGPRGFEWLLSYRQYGLSTLFGAVATLGLSALSPPVVTPSPATPQAPPPR